MPDLSLFADATRLRLPEGSDDLRQDACPDVLRDYLDWTLAVLDTATLAIMIKSPEGEEVIVLEGDAATLWLRFHQQGAAGV